MISISFPNINFKLKKISGVENIFDIVRKRWLAITPEEWVRQHVLHFFISELKYPSESFSIEKQFKYNNLKKRFDILIFDKAVLPWMIVEIKSSDTVLTTDVLMQALEYNTKISAKYLVITNGKLAMIWKKENEKFIEQNNFPSYNT